MKESMKSELPKLAMDDIPTPDKDAVTITGLVKEHGRISGYQLSDDRVVSRSEGVELARSGGIRGVGIAHNKDTEYLNPSLTTPREIISPHSQRYKRTDSS